MVCRPNPNAIQSALQHDDGPTATHIEPQPEVDRKSRTSLLMAANEELVHFRLRARGNIDGADFAAVFRRRQKHRTLPAQQHCRRWLQTFTIALCGSAFYQ
jgi:hypothetical protein